MFIMSLKCKQAIFSSFSLREKVRIRGSYVSVNISPSPSPPVRGGKASFCNSVQAQKGVTLVGALFIIVIMALLGTGLLQLMTTSQQSIGQEITSVKAYFASHSATQWGMYQSVYAGGAAVGTNTITFSNSGLTNTTVSTTIQRNIIEGNNYYNITATGQFGVSADREYSQRMLQLRFQF